MAMPKPQPQQETSGPATNWAIFCHLSSFLGYFFPLGNLLFPLGLWLWKRQEFDFVDDQGKEVVNFQITMSLVTLVGVITAFILIGFVILFVVGLIHIIFTIIAAVKASQGIPYRYPLTYRFIS